jgi:DnaJ-class molecular chaperone
MYAILGVDKRATEDEIRTAYKRMAKKFHPDTPSGSEEIFKKVNEAYEVLSDTYKRKQYDRRTALKTHISSFTQFDAHGFKNFGSFFQNSSDNPSAFFSNFEPQKTTSTERGAPVEIKCSLSEFFHGSRKTVRFVRKKWQNHSLVNQLKTFQVNIAPGSRPGKTIRFVREGNDSENSDQPPTDVVFVLKQAANESWRIEGNDLLMQYEMTLLESLTGNEFVITAASGKEMKVPFAAPVASGEVVTVVGEGFPIDENSKSRGNLRISICVKSVPQPFTREHKQRLKTLLRSYNDGPST